MRSTDGAIAEIAEIAHPRLASEGVGREDCAVERERRDEEQWDEHAVYHSLEEHELFLPAFWRRPSTIPHTLAEGIVDVQQPKAVEEALRRERRRIEEPKGVDGLPQLIMDDFLSLHASIMQDSVSHGSLGGRACVPT